MDFSADCVSDLRPLVDDSLAQPPRRSVASWILYDMANTLFSFNIVSVYYALWLKDQDLGGLIPDTVLAAGNIASMAIVFVTAPWLGALSDRTRRRVPLLAASTVACVLATFPIGLVPWQASLLFFVAANIGFQLGLVVYDALLPIVSHEKNRGRIGALGVGVGYLGSLLGLGVGSLILRADADNEPLVFIATSVGFLLFALPAFFWIQEPIRERATLGRGTVWTAARESFAGLARVLRGRDVPNVRRFLIGRLFYTDAANTMIIFMALYATLEAGFTEGAIQAVLLMGILGAVFLAWPWGVLVDRVGPKNTLDLVLLCWMFGLTIVVLVPVLDLPKEVFYPLAFILGASLAGLWAADRPLLIGLVPRERIGEFYGFYAMMGRFTAIVGPLLWAAVAEPRILNLGRPVAVLSLLAFMVVAFLIFRGLPDPRHPGTKPLARVTPWGGGEGRIVAHGWRRLVSAPFLLVYVVASWVLFVPNAQPMNGFYELRPNVAFHFTYRIPTLSEDPLIAIRSLVTAPWLNHHSVQLVYVTILLALFGFVFEAKEGTRRTMFVFFATTLVGALVAGILLHFIYPDLSSDAFFRRAWEAQWSGGSAGAFGLMGALAARARNPWPLFVFFVFWEINVGYWYLKSYTPAFHVTALITGFLLARYAVRPMQSRRPAVQVPGSPTQS